MSTEPEVVPGEKVTIAFEAHRCIHSRYCVLTRPDVFVPNVQGEWIHPDAASVEAVTALAHNCPSGAITYQRHDGGPQEEAPVVNLIRVRENGPLAFHAELAIEGQEPRLRATLCRCGASKSKPFCDGSHNAIAFSATGEPATVESTVLPVRNGKLTVRPKPNGPLLVEGPMEVVTGTGRTANRIVKAALCRCGHSSNKPYCDGTHNKIGFTTE